METEKPSVLDQRFSVNLALQIARQVVNAGRGNVNIIIVNQPQGVQVMSDNGQKIAMSDNPFGNENLAQNIEDMESYFLKRAINISHGVKAQAARLLGMKRSTFYEKCKKYGIEEEGG